MRIIIVFILACCQFILLKGEDIDQLLQKGYAQHISEHYFEALYYYNSVLEKDATNETALLNRGLVRAYFNDDSGACEDFSRIDELAKGFEFIQKRVCKDNEDLRKWIAKVFSKNRKDYKEKIRPVSLADTLHSVLQSIYCFLFLHQLWCKRNSQLLAQP